MAILPSAVVLTASTSPRVLWITLCLTPSPRRNLWPLLQAVRNLSPTPTPTLPRAGMDGGQVAWAEELRPFLA